jgi:hypothetical protein
MDSLPHGDDQVVELQAGGGAAARPITCKRCGIPALLCRAHPDTIARRGRRSKVLIIEPWPRPGRGSVVITPDGLAMFSQRFGGDYVLHQCPAMVTKCRHCGQPVRILHQPPGAPEMLAVVEADPDGIIVISSHGHAVCDPGFVLPGKRYSWHSGHGGGGRGGVEALMREVPGGVR